jgi:hypothetical protein
MKPWELTWAEACAISSDSLWIEGTRAMKEQVEQLLRQRMEDAFRAGWSAASCGCYYDPPDDLNLKWYLETDNHE